jgi:hypothetical protein
MYQHRFGPRSEYRMQESQRVKNSPVLAEKFPKLKSLTVNLEYYGPENLSKISQIKYSVNLSNARSVFRFNCPNTECISGDFDLSDQLAKAVAGRRATVEGEMKCHGWRSKTTIDTVHCHNVLRYKLTLAF